MRDQARDVSSVFLSPDIDHGVRISAVNRRRECGREDEISKVVERDENDTPDWLRELIHRGVRRRRACARLDVDGSCAP